MSATFKIIKETFEQVVYFVDDEKEFEVCRVSQYSDALEVYSKFVKNNASKPVFLEIDFKKNRDVELRSHFINGTQDTLRYYGFTGLGDLKVGKTPSKIKRLFKDEKKSYLEAYSKCKSVNGIIYFSIRHLTEIVENELGFKERKESFLIGAYLYDPKSINDEIYQPLQAVYALKIDRPKKNK